MNLSPQFTRYSATYKMPLDELIVRLRRRKAIDGIMVIGSTARDDLTSASDYDLAIVGSDMVALVDMGNTIVHGRHTDLRFLTVQELNDMIGPRGRSTRTHPTAARYCAWETAGSRRTSPAARLHASQGQASSVPNAFYHPCYFRASAYGGEEMMATPEDEACTLGSDRLALSPMVQDDACDLFGLLREPALPSSRGTHLPQSADELRERIRLREGRRSPDGVIAVGRLS